MFQENIPPLLENISCFNLHRYEQTHLYPILKGYTDNNAWQMLSSYRYTYSVSHDALMVQCAGPRWGGVQANLYVLCEVFARLKTIIIKLVPVLLAKFVCLCHSEVNCTLRTGVNMTGVNRYRSF